MKPTEPTVDLILSQADEQGECTVCEHRSSQLECLSCNPSHYLCRDCIVPHRDDFNYVLG